MKTQNKINILFIALAFSFCGLSQTNTPQGVSINNAQTPPSKNAMLDVVSTEKGMLVPRVEFSVIESGGTLAPVNVIAGEDGLLVFVKTPGANYGYWYFDVPDNAWKRMGSGGGGTLILTWDEMHDLAVTNTDLGKMVYVSDCNVTCGGYTFDSRGLYYYDGVGNPEITDQITGCDNVRRWRRVTDGRCIPRCPINGGAPCPITSGQSPCGDLLGN